MYGGNDEYYKININQDNETTMGYFKDLQTRFLKKKIRKI